MLAFQVSNHQSEEEDLPIHTGNQQNTSQKLFDIEIYGHASLTKTGIVNSMKTMLHCVILTFISINVLYCVLYTVHLCGIGHMVKDHSDSERKSATATWATLSN